MSLVDAVAETIAALRKKGFGRLYVNGQTVSLEDVDTQALKDRQLLQVIVDRVKVEPDMQARLTDSIETALKFGEGYVSVNLVDQKEDIHFSEHLACPEHGVSIAEVEPRTFSFNTPQGACPA